MVDLAMELDGHMSPEMCTEITERFGEQLHENIELNVLAKDGHERYLQWLDVMLPWKPPRLCHLKCSAMEVRKAADGGEWTENSQGTLSFIWYLSADGETDFLYKKVKARPGKLVIFPSTWNYIHKDSSSLVIRGYFT
jgi:hypothetical protein